MEHSLFSSSFLLLILCSSRFVACQSASYFQGTTATLRTIQLSNPSTKLPQNAIGEKKLWILRGGDQSDEDSDTSDYDDSSEYDTDDDTSEGGGESQNDEDEERYSRQVYTLGSRAHGRIRSSTVYLDGPATSGLVYECAKNLALSGVKKLLIVKSASNTKEKDELSLLDHQYHNSLLDDLGNAYQRGARSELGLSEDDKMAPEELLLHYLQRLNPSILVSAIERSDLFQVANEKNKCDSTPSSCVLLCMDRPYPTQIKLNEEIARKNGWPFISVETAGVFGRIFCDFGKSFEVFDSDGETPLVTPLDKLSVQSEGENDVIVHCVDGEKHDVSKGDSIQFQLRNGEMVSTNCIVSDVQTPYRFRVKIETADNNNLLEFVSHINTHAASFQRIKIPQNLSFEPIQIALENARSDPSLFAACDLEKSFDEGRRNACMSCFQALPAFVQDNRRHPRRSDMKVFQKIAKSAWMPNLSDESDSGRAHFKHFLHGCAAKLTPFQAVFGAIAAQETIKAATGLYNPVRQFLLYDCDEMIQNKIKKIKQPEVSDDAAIPNNAGLRHILGEKVVDKLSSRKLFVVGAGAIGCEILKNLAAMGAGTGRRGKVVLTDMDTIEKSNLSRQLLFRDADIGKFKSAAAREATLLFEPGMKIECHSSKVGAGESSPFDEKFWSKRVDIILNALDNVEARLYMDGKCVENKKALVDAGTMGPKGNVQVVVPDKSESYSSSVDPPEPAIPVCTLKNFPYAISHTIQWARNLFDGLYEKRPEQAKAYIVSASSTDVSILAAKYVQEMGDESALETALQLRDDLDALKASEGTKVATVREDSLEWAVKLSYQLFYKASLDLLEKHPPNSVDEDGEPFWSGTRRPPKALLFVMSEFIDSEQQVVNRNLVDFVASAARLRTETILGDRCTADEAKVTEEEAESALKSFTPEAVAVDNENSGSESFVLSKVESFLHTDVPSSLSMTPVEFEKDDDTNGHVAFVSAASNLRAICYGIPPVDAMETRRVAGNIVPAMITTTALVSALSCIELAKLVQESALEHHRNAFINLALPFFAFTIPMEASKTPGLQGRYYTLWDRLLIKENSKHAKTNGISMKSVLRKIRTLASDEPDNVSISSISCGPFMLYADFLHENDDSVLKASLWDLINEAMLSSESFENEFSREEDEDTSDFILPETYVDLVAVVQDEMGEEIELPPIRVEKFSE